ncbi:sensor histidine kinase [Pseudorhodoferax sp.]|uniref:sensor histidine kinase n=1 Tax=Pseudorhodoferax sp. TaxID=1993553 RepID=UPI002DD63606|nr:ATP-binding protein [Pseudorhodoferax sp.]
MTALDDASPPSDFDPRAVPALAPVGDLAMTRAWYGFMTARTTIALALALLQTTLYALTEAVPAWVLAMCALYFASALSTRLLARPRLPRHALDPTWLMTVGMDVLVIALLQLFQSGTISYTPLLGVPVLLTAVLGTRPMAIGMALAITALLLLETWWASTHGLADATGRYLQAGLAGLGYLLVSFLANQLAARLVREEQQALANLHAARLQAQVNQLVMETLTDGVLVVDGQTRMRTANPAAHVLLSLDAAATLPDLAAQPSWMPLLELAQQTFAQAAPQTADVTVRSLSRGARRLRVRTRMTEAPGRTHERLCVMFLHDLREAEARTRTEKMAAMGRMSAAVAHEIRNPLAAIAQANALLDEELEQPGQRQLTRMIQHNAQRLSKIVDEVLDVARVPEPGRTTPPSLLLDALVQDICDDWAQRAPRQRRVRLDLATQGLPVDFDSEHLRRVLVNLLDNALRYASERPAAIQVSTRLSSERASSLQVWSDGAPLEESVERHLFEPFFSSESRSSGLGLYICRELCERHRASIGYQRAARHLDGASVPGNEFHVQFRPPKPAPHTPTH